MLDTGSKYEALAKSYLNECALTDYKETSRCLVHRYLGTTSRGVLSGEVLFMEGDLLRYIFSRKLVIEEWLRVEEDRSPWNLA